MKKTAKFIFSTVFVFCVSWLTCYASASSLDSVLIDDPIYSDGLAPIVTGGNIIFDNWETWLTVISVLIYLVIRLVPSAKNWDPLVIIMQIIDFVLPNRAKLSDGSKGRFRYRKDDPKEKPK